MRARIGIASAFSAVLLSASPALALTFACITGNSAANCATGEAQLSVDVSDVGGGKVLFTFHNSGPEHSSIADVYFGDQNLLLAFDAIVDSPGVEFSQGATPHDLPGAKAATPSFLVTAGLVADSDPPVQPNGVNPGETLGMRFDLQAGATFADVLAALAHGSLRIGIHVQGFGDGGSESFVSQPLPEPGSLALLVLACASLGARRWLLRAP